MDGTATGGLAEQRMHDDRPRTLAAIDIGSNSIKMTVATWDERTGLRETAWASETVRLGLGLDATNRLADDRVEAALDTLTRFAADARAHGATRIVAVATEATRAATNGAAFLARVAAETGIEVRAITGDEEAALTFAGLAATADVSGEVVVADVGGGSTELIGASGGAVVAARSLRLGSGRLTDRLVPSDPPTAAELAACRAEAAAMLAAVSGLALPSGAGSRLIVVGGTGEYLRRLVDGDVVTPAAVDAVIERLQKLTADELAVAADIPPARARVLPAGVAIAAGFADGLQPGAISIARSGIRAGLLLQEFASRPPIPPGSRPK